MRWFPCLRQWRMSQGLGPDNLTRCGVGAVWLFGILAPVFTILRAGNRAFNQLVRRVCPRRMGWPLFTYGALGDRHHAMFGALVQRFAHHEALIDGVIATLSGASVASVKLLMASLDFVQKCDALLNLMRHRGIPVAQYDRVLRFTNAPRTHFDLFRDILHSTWAKSESQNVIYPKWLSHGPAESVKPLHNVGTNGGAFQEWPEDRTSYTLDDLDEISQLLVTNCEEFHMYPTEHALIGSVWA